MRRHLPVVLLLIIIPISAIAKKTSLNQICNEIQAMDVCKNIIDFKHGSETYGNEYLNQWFHYSYRKWDMHCDLGINLTNFGYSEISFQMNKPVAVDTTQSGQTIQCKAEPESCKEVTILLRNSLESAKQKALKLISAATTIPQSKHRESKKSKQLLLFADDYRAYVCFLAFVDRFEKEINQIDSIAESDKNKQ